MSKDILINCRLSNPALHFKRIGGLVRDDKLMACNELEDVLRDAAEKYNVKATYDVSYGGAPQDLSYTEIMASMFQGIYALPCDKATAIRQIQNAIVDENNTIDYCERARNADGLYDKYVLHTFNPKQYRKVVFLPGSNLIKQAVDKNALNEAVDMGAYVKMHPLTNREIRDRLQSEYGDRVIPRRFSGFKILKDCEQVFTTGTSELGLYAMLLGKRVIDISTNHSGGGYSMLFKVLSGMREQGKHLSYAMNSKKSGIFFPGEEEEIRKFVSRHSDRYNTNTRVENRGNITPTSKL